MKTSTIIIIGLIISASIASANAAPIDDVRSWLQENLKTLYIFEGEYGQHFVKNVVETETQVAFDSYAQNYNWLAVMTNDATGAEISRQSGYSARSVYSGGKIVFEKPTANGAYTITFTVIGVTTAPEKIHFTVPMNPTPTPTPAPASTSTTPYPADTSAPTPAPEQTVINIIPEPIATAAGIKQSPGFEFIGVVLAGLGAWRLTKKR